ncbi:hypothetical protein SSCG_00113 [Streptomyces clavuligerus]|nr:hypothetical protein SSCG_00113 [Streptomyces clavuligerus]
MTSYVLDEHVRRVVRLPQHRAIIFFFFCFFFFFFIFFSLA